MERLLDQHAVSEILSLSERTLESVFASAATDHGLFASAIPSAIAPLTSRPGLLTALSDPRVKIERTIANDKADYRQQQT
jgi:hypothetical protein